MVIHIIGLILPISKTDINTDSSYISLYGIHFSEGYINFIENEEPLREYDKKFKLYVEIKKKKKT